MSNFLEHLLSSAWNTLREHGGKSAKEAAGLSLGCVVKDEAVTRREYLLSCARRTTHLALLGVTGSGKSILGALELASQIFAEEKAKRKELIVLSDMRQNTAALNLETPIVLPEFSAVRKRCAPIPDLGGVHVAVLGAGGEGRSTAYWSNLRAFWAEYFRQSGADLEAYSVLRQLPGIR
jgi:hypothetical protein